MDNLPKRKHNRLSGYDYSTTGAYFITVCVNEKKCILSQIHNVGADTIRPQNELTKLGELVEKAIVEIPLHYKTVSVDNYVIMPNHIHMLLSIVNNGGRMVSAPTVIGSLKRYVSKESGTKIWQKGFYDHIVRNDEDYYEKMQYIDENPKKWLIGKDEYYS